MKNVNDSNALQLSLSRIRFFIAWMEDEISGFEEWVFHVKLGLGET